MALRASVLVAALVALLAVPSAARATEPWVCLVVDKAFWTPVEGQPHEIDASCTGDPDGHDLVLFEYDFDGDGTYDASSGSTPFRTHTWTDRGAHLDAAVVLGVRVTDAAGESGVYNYPLRVTDAINSWFRFEPQLANPGDPVKLTAYINPVDEDRSHRFAWDLDADGSFEHDAGGLTETTMVAPDAVGRHRVGLRVTDDEGTTSTVRREIEVLPRHPSRDLIPWVAPANLQSAPPPSHTPPVGTNTGPVGPDMPTVEPTGTASPKPRKVPKLRKIDANRHGLAISYGGGPRWSRCRLTVRLPAHPAAQYGLGNRTIVLARGNLVLNGRGAGTARMRWTKGAYRMFRQVRRGLVDIVGRRVA